MKKSRIIPSITAFICLLCLSCASADEILFRGIPWGTSVQDIEKRVSSWYSYSYENSMPLETSMTIDTTWRTVFTNGTDFVSGYICHVTPQNINVGGYEAYGINFYCRFDMHNGLLDKGKGSSILYAADYELKTVDPEAAYNNLKSKLTDLYGEGIETKTVEESMFSKKDYSIGTYTYVYAYTVWNGDNNTHVVLCGQWIDDEHEDEIDSMVRLTSENLFITYYQGGHDEILKRISLAEEQLEKEEEAQNATGYDGL